MKSVVGLFSHYFTGADASPRRLWLQLFGLLLINGPNVHANTAQETVWIGHTQDEQAELTAYAVRSSLLKARPEVKAHVAPWHDFEHQSNTPSLLIAVGSLAVSGMAKWFPQLPMLAASVSRHELLSMSATAQGSISGIWADQPIERMLALAKITLPMNSQIAVLIGPQQKKHTPEIIRKAKKFQLSTRTLETDVGQLASKLRQALEDADTLLALPEPSIINGQTLGHILSSAYRRNVPVLTFSRSYVRAGALGALYTSPTQYGDQLAQFAIDILLGKEMPAPTGPLDFEIAINLTVARSLGIKIDSEIEIKTKIMALLTTTGNKPP
jgi:putative tryptophan/tyrosine transport system substrate-binding protein